MCIGAQDRIDQFGTKSAAHRHRRDQGKHRQGDPNQADPSHDADAAIGTFCPQIPPCDHEFIFGKGHRKSPAIGDNLKAVVEKVKGYEKPMAFPADLWFL